MMCSNCGAENTELARFCGRCGRACGGAVVRSMTTLTPLLARWRQVSLALTRKEVRKILGEPLRIESRPAADHAAAHEVWIYEYQSGDGRAEGICGWVSISVAESRVLGWSEPDWTRLAGPD